MKLSRWAVAALPLALAACGLGKAMSAHTDVVASADGKELKVEDAAAMLAANPQLEPSDQLVRALADLWVDYTLLASAASEDTTLAVIDLDQLVEPQRQERTLMRLMEQVAGGADTTFTDAEVQAKWLQEGPGNQVRARHILIKAGADATPAQRDSAKRKAEGLRAQAAGGADFAQLAQANSEDISAQQGGDLGFFGKGSMVPAFEQAAFALQPGQISPVIETPYGYHVIKVEERKQEEIGDRAPAFRQAMARQAQNGALQKFVDSVNAAAKPEVRPGAVKFLKELAAEGDLQLRGRAADRPLVGYRGGEVTAGELAEILQGRGGQMLEQLKEAPDDQVESSLKDLATREILLNEARRRNLLPSAAAVDSIRSEARIAIRELLRSTGFGHRRIPKGSGADAAIEQQVREVLQQIVAGQRPALPLGPLGSALRKNYDAEVNAASFQRVVERAKAIRATQPPVQLPQGMPGQQGAPQQAPPQPQPQPQQPPAPPPAGDSGKQ